MTAENTTAVETNETPVAAESNGVAAPAAAKPAGKKAVKKAAAKKAVKGKAPVKGKATKKAAKAPRVFQKVERADEKERNQAKAAGLSIPHLRVLRAIDKSSKPLSYKEIEAKTGYYSNLTMMMRTDHEGSLANQKYVKEELHDRDGRDVLCFAITAAGKKVLEKAK